MKRELKTRPIFDCRCDERLNPKDDESMSLIHWVVRGTGIPLEREEVFIMNQ